MQSLPLSFVPRRHHFGLSLGRTSLRAVEMTSSGSVRTSAEVILPDGVYNEGVLIQKDQFLSGLNKLLSDGRFSTPFVAVCFSEAHAYSREYQVPLLPEAEIGEAISYHVQDLFPLPITELYFDWKLLESNETGHRVVVVAVQKKLIDPLVEALVSVKLKPLSFEPGAATVTRLLHLKSRQQVLVSEVNRRGAYVTLVEGEKTIFTTVIAWTSDDTPETYLSNISQTIIEMSQYYKKKGVLTSENVPVILTGEVANEEVAKYINAKTNFPIQILVTSIKNPAFNKAYAIAATNVSPPLDNHSINLLPADLQKRYDSQWANEFYTMISTRSLIIVTIFLLLAIGSFVSLLLSRQGIEARVKQISNNSSSNTTSTQKLLLLNSQAKNIVLLASLRKTPQDKLLVINELLTDGISITQWEYDDSKLTYTLSGVAINRESLLNFKNKLEESEEFTKITLPLGSLETPENIRFNISFVSKK